MNKINLPINIFNPDTPSNFTIIKDLPKAIRDKSLELISVITLLEEKRVSSTIKEVLDIFPESKSIFIQGNGSIPDALYNKRGDSWVGIGNFNYLPILDDNIKIGTRKTIFNKVYELSKIDNIFIWVEKPEIIPALFFDFFETPTGDIINCELNNRGNLNPDIKLIVNSIKKYKPQQLPYIQTFSNSELKTSLPAVINTQFTFSTTFLKISRNYYNTDIIIPKEHNAVLLYIKDEFENVKIGLCYDKDNNLCYFDKTTITKLNFVLSEEFSYQLALQLHEDEIKVIVNGKILYSVNNSIIKNKRLFFSICNDLNYGQYANGACILSEVMVSKDILSKEELINLYEKPRSFSLLHDVKTYLDLDLKDKIILKEKIIESKNNINDPVKYKYLTELKLANLYLTEISLGIITDTDKELVKEYLIAIKAGGEAVRPSVLNNYV